MTKEEIENEVSEIIKWTIINGDKVERMYKTYRAISGDTNAYCSKCPQVIRNIHLKIRQYYLNSIKEKTEEKTEDKKDEKK